MSTSGSPTSQFTPAFERLRDAQITLMQNTFSKNMTVLRQTLPAVYDYYKQYTPQDVVIEMDDRGYLNVLQNGQFIYDDDPEALAKKQVEFYQRQPRHFHFQPNTQIAVARPGPTFMHGHYLHRINQAGQTLNQNTPTKHIRHLPMLVIIGSGLGYHIRDLLQVYQVRHLLIYEPNPDLFYASLFVTDYTDIIKHCTARHHSITLKIDGSASTFCNEVSSIVHKHGIFNCTHVFIYRHYRSEAADAAFELLHELAHRLMQGWGFVEDELISIAHTLYNFRHPAHVLLPSSQAPQLPQTDNDLPAFLIANGPSLDKDLAYLRKHRDCGVLISAGSTIATLHHAGITPDFHVEIERGTNVPKNFLALPDEYLSTITLLTINPIHADTCKRFKKVIFAFKHHDIGTQCASGSLSDFADDPLINCNPLAGNGAMAFALRLGFTQLVFFGLDMSTNVEGEHHAQNSLYYTSTLDNFASYRQAYPLKRKGNRREHVYTNETLDFSRFGFEVVLEKNPDIKAWNCSDGLDIKGTTTLDAEQLDFAPNPSAKAARLHAIHAQYTKRVENGFDPTLEKFKHHLNLAKQCRDSLMDLLNQNIRTVADLLDVFSEQTHIVESYRHHSMVAYQILIGSLRYVQTTITTWAIYIPDDEQLATYIHHTLQVMRDYFRTVFSLLEDKYQTLADQYNPTEYLAPDEYGI